MWSAVGHIPIYTGETKRVKMIKMVVMGMQPRQLANIRCRVKLPTVSPCITGIRRANRFKNVQQVDIFHTFPPSYLFDELGLRISTLCRFQAYRGCGGTNRSRQAWKFDRDILKTEIRNIPRPHIPTTNYHTKCKFRSPQSKRYYSILSALLLQLNPHPPLLSPPRPPLQQDPQNRTKSRTNSGNKRKTPPPPHFLNHQIDHRRASRPHKTPHQIIRRRRSRRTRRKVVNQHHIHSVETGH